MENKILVILGMHRSGTSLITQWLYKCGLNIGDDLLGADIGNKEGHFEDTDFVNIHEEILITSKIPAEYMKALSANDIDENAFKKLAANIQYKNSLYDQWGWKDPRTCLFLEQYRQLLPGAKYVVILRDWNAVVYSLLSRKSKLLEIAKLKNRSSLYKLTWNLLRKEKQRIALFKQSAEAYLKIWINYNEALLHHINLIPAAEYIVVNYKMMITESSFVLDYLKNNWLFDLQAKNYTDVYKENLMSNKSDISIYITDRSLVKKADDLYDELMKFTYSANDTKT